MPANPFSTPDPPDPNPGIQRSAEASERVGLEQVQLGRDQLAWQQAMDAWRMGVTEPIINQQIQIGNEQLQRARDQSVAYDTYYRPVENLQVYDSLGASWLSPEEQGRIVDLFGANQMANLEDAFKLELRSLNARRQRDLAAPPRTGSAARAPAPATPAAAAAPALPGRAAGVGAPLSYLYGPGSFMGMQYQTNFGPQAALGVPPPAAGPTQAQITAAERKRINNQYARDKAQAVAEYEANKRQGARGTALEKELIGVQKAAEDAAAGMATADAAQSEQRMLAGVTAEAARMGVDPSVAIANAGARAPSTVAASVDAGNRARFGVRGQRGGALLNTAQFGRNMPSTATNIYGAGVGAGNAAAGNTNSTVNSMTAGRDSARGWFSGGAGAIGQAGGLYNAQYGNQLNAWQFQNQPSPLWDLAGTAAGMWAYNGFPMPSSREIKTDKAPMDTPETLDMVKGMDTDVWTYKPGAGDGGRHVGPYADDMQRAGLSDGKMVNPMDVAGLSLAAVKQLAKEVESMRTQLGIPSPRRTAA